MFRRKMRGERVVPIIELSHKQMRTKKFGLKARQHFEVTDWRIFSGSAVPAIPAPAQELPGEPVAPLTAAEIVWDEIPDHPTPKKARNGKAKQAKPRPADPDDNIDDLPW